MRGAKLAASNLAAAAAAYCRGGHRPASALSTNPLWPTLKARLCMYPAACGRLDRCCLFGETHLSAMQSPRYHIFILAPHDHLALVN